MRERMTVNNLLIKEKVNRYDDGIQFPNCPEEKRRVNYNSEIDKWGLLAPNPPGSVRRCIRGNYFFR